MPDDQGREPGAQVDERGSRTEHGGEQQPHRDGDVEAGPLLHEQDARRTAGVQEQELTGREEGQRQQQHACVTSAVRGVARRVGQTGGERAHGHEQDEVEARVGEVRVEV
ncbi:MAG: hypothetical protein ACR2K3_08810 [Nocardioides sp.]